MLGDKYMDSIHTTTNTNTWIINPNPNITDSWFSVSAKKNNGKGRRAVAINAQAINSVCSGYGCTDQSAYNYSPLATFNDGSCCYVTGCTDITAVNYNLLACYDDGSCQAPILGCTNPQASNYDPNANTPFANGGALDNTFGTGGFFNGDQHLNFDASKECVIKSATIYSEFSNVITFELRNSTGAILDDTTLNVVSGQQQVNLNFNVPIASDLQLGVSQGALQIYGLYRNNSGSNYPYDIGSAINITSSSATGNNGQNAFSYYYYYYDIEVEAPCNGASAVSWDCDGQGSCYDPGTGNGQYSSLSQCQSSCVVPSWDCDGQGNCYDPGTGNGQYNNLAACQFNCIALSWDCEDGTCYDPGNGQGFFNNLSDCQYNCTNVSIDEFDLIAFKIYPNPSRDVFYITFTSEVVKDLRVVVRNVIGKELIVEDLIQFVGEYTKQINLKDNVKGIYLLEIKTDEGVINKKLILQ